MDLGIIFPKFRLFVIKHDIDFGLCDKHFCIGTTKILKCSSPQLDGNLSASCSRYSDIVNASVAINCTNRGSPTTLTNIFIRINKLCLFKLKMLGHGYYCVVFLRKFKQQPFNAYINKCPATWINCELHTTSIITKNLYNQTKCGLYFVHVIIVRVSI